MADLYYNVRIEGVTQSSYVKFMDYFDNQATANKITVASCEYSPSTQILSFTSCGVDPETFIKGFVDPYVAEELLTPTYSAVTEEDSTVHALKKKGDPKIIITPKETILEP